MPLITIKCPLCDHTIQQDIEYPRKSLRYFCPECKKMVTVFFYYPDDKKIPVQIIDSPRSGDPILVPMRAPTPVPVPMRKKVPMRKAIPTSLENLEDES